MLQRTLLSWGNCFDTLCKKSNHWKASFWKRVESLRRCRPNPHPNPPKFVLPFCSASARSSKQSWILYIFSCNNALRALRYQHFCCSRVELNAAHLRMYGAQCADRLGCVLCCSPHLLLPPQETWKEHEWASGHPIWNKKWSPRVFHGESFKLKKAQIQNKVKWYDTVML